jgi:mevalonate kinase
MIQEFFANGKLLISGEYLVLHGARALVVPLTLGQQMQVESMDEAKGSLIHWQAYDRDKEWFNAVIRTDEWDLIGTSDSEIAGKLIGILKEVDAFNDKLFESRMNYRIKTNSQFNMNWGFGSSSALIANLARWAGIDPFLLYFKVSEGSGADLAAAISGRPVVYTLNGAQPVITGVDFKPSFQDKIWFVYRGHKQSSAGSVTNFQDEAKSSVNDVETISLLTDSMLKITLLADFEAVVRDHERLISGVLGKKRIKEVLFDDFEGEVKSLGAWGGDFIMAVTSRQEDYVRAYFAGKGLKVIIPFDTLVKYD